MAGRIAYYGNIVKDGLVLDLDAAKKDSYPRTGTVWNDVSGNNYYGTLTNGPTYDSSMGGNIVFDGSNDYISIIDGYTNIIKNNNNWTVSLWFKANDLSNYPVLLSVGTGQLSYYDLFLEVGPNQVYFAAGGGAGVNFLYNPSTTLTTNTIYNITFIKTGTTTGKVYVNGSEISLITFGTGLGAMPNSNADFKIGDFKSSGYTLNGNIYQTLIYNRSLSSTEILQNYNATKTRFGL